MEVVEGFVEMMMKCYSKASTFWLCANRKVFLYVIHIVLLLLFACYSFKLVH